MGLYFLLGLLGIAALGEAFGLFDGRDDDRDQDPADAGQRLYVKSGESVDAGAGNDTISVHGSEDRLGPGAEVWGGKGDDLITNHFTVSGGDVLHGGAGNDTIASESHESRIFGDSGDDRLTANRLDSVYGGTGQDEIIFTNQGTAAGSFGDGGEGNDRLYVTGGVFQDSDDAGIVLHGGGGDDSFVMDITSFHVDETNSGAPVQGGRQVFAHLRDFDPDKDKLTIDVSELGVPRSGWPKLSLNGDTLTVEITEGIQTNIVIDGLTAKPGFTVDDIAVVRA